MIRPALITRLEALRAELDQILAELAREDAAARIDAAQASVPETPIGGTQS